MSVKIFDTMTTATPNFPLAYAEKINIVKEDGSEADIQTLYNNGELSGGDTSQTLTEAEYLALPEEQKLNNSYYLYDIGVHYKNGVAYSRKKPIQLTMEEYKALGEVDPDQEYIVSADEQGILLEAEDIGYNNAVSNLPCTTVQGAIDKVVEKIHSYFYPTGVITDIEVGENGAIYIAPSDGFVQVTVTSTGVTDVVGYASIITSNPANSVSLIEPTGNNQRVKTFVKKGEEYRVYYSVRDNGLITLKHYALV